MAKCITINEILSTDSWSTGRIKINDNFSVLTDKVCEVIDALSLDIEFENVSISGELCADEIKANIISLPDCNSGPSTIVLDGGTGVITATSVIGNSLRSKTTLSLDINAVAAGAVEGMIRWSGIDFFGYDGNTWLSLTSSGNSNIWQTNGATNDIFFDPNNISPGGVGVAIGRDTAEANFHLEGDLILDIAQSPAIQAGFVLTSTTTGGRATWQASPIGTMGGSGTIDRHAKFTAATTLGDGLIGDDGTDITIFGRILPDVDDTKDIGSPALRIRDIYMGSDIDFATNLIFKRATVEKMRLNSSGLGIGVTPTVELEVSGYLTYHVTW